MSIREICGRKKRGNLESRHMQEFYCPIDYILQDFVHRDSSLTNMIIKTGKQVVSQLVYLSGLVFIYFLLVGQRIAYGEP